MSDEKHDLEKLRALIIGTQRRMIQAYVHRNCMFDGATSFTRMPSRWFDEPTSAAFEAPQVYLPRDGFNWDSGDECDPIKDIERAVNLRVVGRFNWTPVSS